MNLNLRNRILLPILALLIAVIVVLTGTSFFMSRRALDASTETQLQYIGDQSLHQVESWIEGQRTDVTHWAAQPHMLAALRPAPEGGPARAAVSAQLSDASRLYGFYANLQLVDLNGLTLSSSNPDSIGQLNVADRQYFKDAAAGKVVISEVLQSKSTGNPIVVVAAPVKDGPAVRGVLFASLDLHWLSANLLDKIKVLETGYVFLYDEKGLFITHPERGLIMTAKLADFEWAAPLQRSASGEVIYAYKGVEKMARFANSPTLHWGLVVNVPVSEMVAPVYRIGRINLVLGLGALVMGTAIALFLARSLARPIQEIAVQLNTCSSETISAAAQVSDAGQNLAAGANQQASSLEETSTSLKEMAATTKRNADNAKHANELARTARQAADAGSSDMQAMSLAMTEIKRSSDDIAKIIKTIDEIAFQTNILALNAAVEAARAGEAGMGFAVVAEEVRALAQRSATAAQETADKIEGAIAKTTQGVQISGQVTTRLAEIVEKVRQVDGLIAEVATASREQNHGVQQINDSIGQMDKVVQTNAASAEESAAAAEELNAQALALNEIIGQLRGLVDGKTTHAPAGAPARPPAPAVASSASAAAAAPAPVAANPGLVKPQGAARPAAEAGRDLTLQAPSA
ncbi:MAG: methyl-accepting chemotaxis protein [Verrucomicrobia bacterium]|nr:methyl-accepting chemotaxis protein [Verrucomicrobiota bacterium]